MRRGLPAGFSQGDTELSFYDAPKEHPNLTYKTEINHGIKNNACATGKHLKIFSMKC